jgi:hypothetical protein
MKKKLTRYLRSKIKKGHMEYYMMEKNVKNMVSNLKKLRTKKYQVKVEIISK